MSTFLIRQDDKINNVPFFAKIVYFICLICDKQRCKKMTSFSKGKIQLYLRKYNWESFN